ncbi:aldo/keto reductase [Amnibacterium endophyticum]|uniref:Aldo/keto reductase n=1 Tax=Amnibacterium endophyticum TaxID=2109337 RepID=A0ABW4LGC4_9MICO
MADLDLGPVVLGGNVFGWTADRDESFAVLDAFVDGGGRAIDTADVYSAWLPGNAGGESESILGEWFASRGRRDDVVLMTKIGAWEARRGLAAATVTAAVDDSLRRLRTDRVDVLLAHRDDPTVPQEETMSALDALVRDGKVRALGASNFSAERLRSAAAVADAAGLTPFTVAQDLWSLVERGIETALVPTLDELGIAETPYSSLASGFLSGKYAPGRSVDSARSKKAGAYLEDPRAVAALDAARDVAEQQGVPVSAVALAWLRAQRTVAAPTASARTVDQVPDLLAAGRVRLTPQHLELLSAATEPVGG